MEHLDLGKIIKKTTAKEHSQEIAATQAKTPYSQPIHNLNQGPHQAILKYDWMEGHEVVSSKMIPDDIYTVDSIQIKDKKKAKKTKKKGQKSVKKGSKIYADEIITLTGIMGASAHKKKETLKDTEDTPSENIEATQAVNEVVDLTDQKPEDTKATTENIAPISAKDSTKPKKEKKKKKKAQKSVKAKKSKATSKSKAQKTEKALNPKKKSVAKAKNKKKASKKKNKGDSWHVFTEQQRVELNDFTNWLNSLDSGDKPKNAELKEEKTSKSDKKKGKKGKKAKKKDEISKKIQSSVVKKDEIVSESLAQLYVKQGHYKKALKAYRKLSLINPEKSSFFAPLIEELIKKV